MNFKKSIYKLFHPAWGEVVMLHRVVVERSKLYDNRLMEISPEDLERTIIAYKDKGYLLATFGICLAIFTHRKTACTRSTSSLKLKNLTI